MMTTTAWSCHNRHPFLFFAVFGVVLGLLAVAVGATPVAAHATFVASTPVRDATIGQPPQRIRVQLDQIPSAEFAEIRVLDANGATVTGGAAMLAAENPAIIETAVAALPPGMYTVVWAALSSDDTHIARGNYSFALTAGLAPAPPDEPQPVGALARVAPDANSAVGSGDVSVLAVVVRWARYLALGVLLGIFGFVVCVLTPVTRSLPEGEVIWRRAVARLRPWLFLGIGGFLLTHIAALVVQAASLERISPLAVRGRTLRRLLYDTTYGEIWRWGILAALTLALGILAISFPRRRMRSLGIVAHPSLSRPATLPPPPLPAPWPWWLGGVAALSLVFTLVLGGHAATVSQRPLLAILAQAAHFGAMGVWFGGLLLLLLVMPRIVGVRDAARQEAARAAFICRFSNVGLYAIATLIATGVYTMTLHTTRATILNTTYGQTLLLKHAVVAPLIAVAAINLLVIRPRLGRAAWAQRWLPRLLLIEAALGAMVLLLTAVVSQLPPANARGGTTLAAGEAVVAVSGGNPFGPNADLTSGPQAVEMVDGSGIMAVLRTTLGTDGSSLNVNLVQPEGIPSEGETLTSEQLANLVVRPLPDVQRVTAIIQFTGADIGQQSVQLVREDDGWYRAYGRFFPIKGEWQMQLVVRRENVPSDARLNFSFVSDPARFQAVARPTAPPIAAPGGLLWPRLLPTAYLGLAFAVLGIAFTVAGRRFGGWAHGDVRHAGVGIALVGVLLLGYSSVTRTPMTDRPNPSANDAATLALGQRLYAQNCAVCHGSGGAGNGAFTARVRPPNLTSGASAAHTDGDWYWYISRGIPGSGMPAFAATFSERDTWAVIRYVRSLRGSE